jgi:5-methylthioadenosine/S-adenosylhomocysteine deaminase
VSNTILIRNATVITLNDARDILPDTSILIRDGRIAALLSAGAALPAADRIIDAAGHVALPGFVNAHTHAAMTLLRGYADDMELQPWLQEKIWPTEAKLQEADVYWGTQLAIAEMLRAGITCFNDMYFFHNAATRACEETGIRACISGVLLGFLPDPEAALAESKRFVIEQKAKKNRVIPMLGPHAPYTCPEPLLQKAIAVAQETGVGIHIHLSETEPEIPDSIAAHGATPIAYMEKLGLFEVTPVLAAHCVWATDADIEILAQHRVGVAHNPGSNMKLASGTAPVTRMLAAGVPVALGTDGAASNNNLDILEEARLAALLAKLETRQPTAVSAYEALSMACRGGAEALGLGEEIGQITVGRQADIILVDMHQPHLWPPHDPVSHLVYAARAGDVRTVLVAGQPLLLAGALQTIDEEKVLVEAAACAARLTA